MNCAEMSYVHPRSAARDAQEHAMMQQDGMQTAEGAAAPETSL